MIFHIPTFSDFFLLFFFSFISFSSINDVTTVHLFKILFLNLLKIDILSIWWHSDSRIFYRCLSDVFNEGTHCTRNRRTMKINKYC